MRHVIPLSKRLPEKAQDLFTCLKDLIEAPLDFVSCVLTKIGNCDGGGGGDC